MAEQVSLTRYAWLSIAAAVVTISLKTGAYFITGSVGLLSDAAESVVNLVAAIIALVALTVAAKPADASHHYGHAKAEYFSAGIEGLMIFVAAAVIIVSAVNRLLHPEPLESLGIGLLISLAATVVNGAVGMLLLRVGRRERSATLVADGKHLMTDVWTSAGVLVGVGLVAITGWLPLDSLVAIAVAINILVVGVVFFLGVVSGKTIGEAALASARILLDIMMWEIVFAVGGFVIASAAVPLTLSLGVASTSAEAVGIIAAIESIGGGAKALEVLISLNKGVRVAAEFSRPLVEGLKSSLIVIRENKAAFCGAKGFLDALGSSKFPAYITGHLVTPAGAQAASKALDMMGHIAGVEC